ncbi:DNA gyrase subunit A [Patescibacteria group bacterium]|nr:DNA gyrase subunit A [Patescibacteria group bacterium]MBU1922399.1 DNA gyrase subunit A [Patescibacteria group bacterium]
MPDKEKKNREVTTQSIVEEMESSYLDYAMSVIISRALPDVRDGLKPVHRRILYAMWDIGLRPGAKFRKSATVVGEVLGKYHPHGDVAVYDAMVKMAQDFYMRYPLVWGQGNFGSMDGDSAAAMRYTEAKLANITEEMLTDIEKKTVDFTPNYDGAHQEPKVLPSKLPNLLLNGTFGIAVGMASNIPPHNLSELIDAITHLIDNPNASVDELCEFVKGPDFPTGGLIYDPKDIKQAYATGKGGIVMRAKTEIVEQKTGVFKIIVHEVPYQVNKASLLEKIAHLVQEKRLEGIRDIRDESSREGVRIVIDLKKEAYPKKILNRLFKLTQLQETFHINMLALVDGIQPRILTLKMILEEYVKHREVIVRRRAEFELERAEERAHILKGLKIALAKIDQVINTIKKSKDKDQAKINLIKKFKLTEVQSIAILEMKLQQLAGLERLKVEQELKDKLKLIKDLEELLKSRKKMLGFVKKELAVIKEKYGDERRTEIVPHGVEEFKVEDLIPKEATIVMLTHDGYIKRLPPDTFRTQTRGGKGVTGLTTKEEDVVELFFSTTTHSDLLFFTTRGRVFQLKAYDVPQTTRVTKGQAMVNFLQLAPGEKVSACLPLDDLKDLKYLVMATRKGLIKKVDIQDFGKVRRSGLIAIKLKTDDYLEWVKPSSGKDNIILITADGQAIQFSEKQVRAMGRAAAGVRGIRLKRNDEVIGIDVVDPSLVSKGKFELAIITEFGLGKRSNLEQYRLQSRGGSGIKTAKITSKNGKIISAFIVGTDEERDLLIISSRGQVIRMPFGSMPSLGRSTQGVRVMRFKNTKDKVASVSLV